jgi:hypothetical protein
VQRDDASVLLCVTLSLMPALLPMGDESAMNLEGVYVSFWTLFFAATFLRVGSELPRTP